MPGGGVGAALSGVAGGGCAGAGVVAGGGSVAGGGALTSGGGGSGAVMFIASFAAGVE